MSAPTSITLDAMQAGDIDAHARAALEHVGHVVLSLLDEITATCDDDGDERGRVETLLRARCELIGLLCLLELAAEDARRQRADA